MNDEGAPRFRRLCDSFALHGVGLHSGQKCSVRVEPNEGEFLLASEGLELPLSRLALDGSGRGSDYIFPDGHRVRTCEHILAAFVGLGIWGVRLTVEGPEMPALDGCAAQMTETLMQKSAPCTEGPAPFHLSSPFRVGDENRFVAVFPSHHFSVTCIVSYDSPMIGTQMLSFTGGAQSFFEDIARARTFAMTSEIEALRAKGMALGGTLDNAILVGENEVQASGGLRYPDEFVRHKTLDLIGDMAAVGCPVCAHLVAMKAGHELHLHLAERLRALVRVPS